MDEKAMADMVNNNPNKVFSTTVYAPEDRPSALDPLGDQDEYYRLKKLEAAKKKSVKPKRKKRKEEKGELKFFPVYYFVQLEVTGKDKSQN